MILKGMILPLLGSIDTVLFNRQIFQIQIQISFFEINRKSLRANLAKAPNSCLWIIVGPFWAKFKSIQILATSTFDIIQKKQKNPISEWAFLFLIGFIPCKAEQPLRGMELQEMKHKKDYGIQKIYLERTYS